MLCVRCQLLHTTMSPRRHLLAQKEQPLAAARRACDRCARVLPATHRFRGAQQLLARFGLSARAEPILVRGTPSLD
jgi:hypothetical protein